MAFAQKKTSKTESRGRHVYGNSRRHSQLLRDYFSDLHHAHIKDLDFLAVLRPRLRKGCRSQNQCINDKHLLIQKALSEWGDLGTSVYKWTIKGRKCRYLSLDLCLLILAALSERLSAYQNQASLLRYWISFRKRFVLQTNSCISCTAEAKVLFKVCLWAKILLSIANFDISMFCSKFSTFRIESNQS